MKSRELRQNLPVQSFPVLRRAKLLVKRWMWPGANWVSRERAVIVRSFRRGTQDHLLDTLDCGCGNGFFTYHAAIRGSRCLGITVHEWERASCDEMRRYLRIPESHMRFQVSTLGELWKKVEYRNFFDQVLLLEVLEHILDAGAALRQIRDLMKEDGLLFVSTPNRDCQGSYPGHGCRVSPWEDGSHVRHGYTFEQLERILETSGFEPLDRASFGTLGSSLVIWIQAHLFRSASTYFTVALLPLLKLLSALLSLWKRPHTISVVARRTPLPSCNP